MKTIAGHSLRKTLFFAVSLLLLLAAAWLVIQWLMPDTIETVHPTRGPAVQAVYATGTVEATVMMPIAPRISARLMGLNVDEGSVVEKDQLLARLEDEDLQQSIKELQAREEFARKQHERDTILIKETAVSRQQFERSRSDWMAAKAAVAKASAELDFMKLTAPANGRIIRRDGEIGQLIPANQPVFWLSCCAPLRISTEVDEEDIALVHPGQKVLIRADAFPDKIYHGEVQGITPKGDPVARSYRVRIGFSEDTPLLIGMTAETNIVIRETQDALLLPSSAVSQEKTWLVEDGKLVERHVSIGAKGPEQVEVLSGVTAEDFVVVKPEAKLKEGQRARPRLAKRDK